jgi:hypothetical protein
VLNPKTSIETTVKVLNVCCIAPGQVPFFL